MLNFAAVRFLRRVFSFLELGCLAGTADVLVLLLNTSESQMQLISLAATTISCSR